MKRLFISFLVAILFITVIIYFFASFILTQLTDQGILTIKQNAGKYGYQVHSIEYGSARLSSFNAVIWREITLDVEMITGDRDRQSYRVSAEIENVSVSLLDFKQRLIELKMKHLKAFRVAGHDESSRKAKVDKTVVKIADFKTHLKLDFMSLPSVRSDFDTIIGDIRGLITHGRTRNLIEFEGNCLFGIDLKPVTARIGAEKDGNEYVVTMNPEDLRKIAQILEEDLNEPEIQLLARNPLRAPRLLKIRNTARGKADHSYSLNQSISADAYRHVMWSYLLTIHYGEYFAKQVTDAHELGDLEDSDADHKMDYHNNNVGRSYAKARLPEHQVMHRAASDSNVIGFVNRVSY